jgi:hypothetical protein
MLGTEPHFGVFFHDVIEGGLPAPRFNNSAGRYFTQVILALFVLHLLLLFFQILSHSGSSQSFGLGVLPLRRVPPQNCLGLSNPSLTEFSVKLVPVAEEELADQRVEAAHVPYSIRGGDETGYCAVDPTEEVAPQDHKGSPR